MGLFSKQERKEEPSRPLPRLPDFPEMPQPAEKPAEFPRYEPTIREIKHEVASPRMVPRGPVAIPQRAPLQHRPAMASPTVMTQTMRPTPKPDQPLFVRIDDYKSALSALDALKERVAEAEKVLTTLERLRTQEDEQMHKWQRELQDLKAKLLVIDHSLFEV